MSAELALTQPIFRIAAPAENPLRIYPAIKSLIVTVMEVDVKTRDKLIAQADEIEQIAGQSSLDLATAVINSGEAMLEAVETKRNLSNAPVLKLNKDINQKAKEFGSPLVQRLVRLKKLRNDFTTAQYRLAEEEERRQKEEARRLEELRRAAVTPEAQAKVHELQAKVLAGVAPEPIRADDTQVRRDPKFDLVNIHILYASRPDLCHPPTPDLVAIKKAINAGLTECPGLANITIDRKVV